MAEELTKHLQRLEHQSALHPLGVDTLERVEILRDLRLGEFDAGGRQPAAGRPRPSRRSLVAILDADKEGFLRNNRSLTQTAIYRAARNANYLVIFMPIR